MACSGFPLKCKGQMYSRLYKVKSSHHKEAVVDALRFQRGDNKVWLEVQFRCEGSSNQYWDDKLLGFIDQIDAKHSMLGSGRELRFKSLARGKVIERSSVELRSIEELSDLLTLMRDENWLTKADCQRSMQHFKPFFPAAWNGLSNGYNYR